MELIHPNLVCHRAQFYILGVKIDAPLYLEKSLPFGSIIINLDFNFA